MLSVEEKKLLREAICAGVFTGTIQQQDSQGRPMFGKKPLTPEILEAVSLKSDEEIKATLVLYSSKKRELLINNKVQLEESLAKINSQLENK